MTDTLRITTTTKHDWHPAPAPEVVDETAEMHRAAVMAANAAWDAAPEGKKGAAYHLAYQRVARVSRGLIVCGGDCALCAEGRAA